MCEERAFSQQPSRHCINQGRVAPETDHSVIVRNVGVPLSTRLVPRDASKSNGVALVERSVLAVLLVRGLSQIVKAIVCTVFHAIDLVVQLLVRPQAGHVKPSQSVGSVGPAVYADDDVALIVWFRARLGSSPDAEAFPVDPPGKYAGVRVVVEKFAQALGAKIGVSHNAVQSQSGQRLASVSSTARASLFYGMT